MKSNNVIGGFVLLVVGMVIFGIGASMVANANAVISEYETIAGEVVRWLSSTDQENYNNAVSARDNGYLLESLGGLMAIIGLIVVIVGFVQTDQKKPQQQTGYSQQVPAQYTTQQPVPPPQNYQQPMAYQQPPPQNYQQPPPQTYTQPQPTPQQQHTQQQQPRLCPSCGKSIPIDGNICPYCGLRQDF